MRRWWARVRYRRSIGYDWREAVRGATWNTGPPLYAAARSRRMQERMLRRWEGHRADGPHGPGTRYPR